MFYLLGKIFQINIGGMRLGFLYAVAIAVSAYYNTLILNENIII